jgi:glucosamine--fructose-6-phosphate aminotransferase (isomerizing)
MCGIVGYVGTSEAWPIVLSALKRLEYRGYDSAGIATINRKRVRVARQIGPISALEQTVPDGLAGSIGIGHTRWATHGGVTVENCHPHTDAAETVALVHNGIIDNVEALRAELLSEGYVFRGQTDSEVLAAHVGRELARSGATLVEAVRRVLSRIDGTAGLVVMSRNEPDKLVAARIGSPVVLGLGDDESWVASDQLALHPFTDRIVVLDDGEIAELSPRGYRTVDLENRSREKRVQKIVGDPGDADRGSHPSFMHKEIFEQPMVMSQGTRGRLEPSTGSARLGGMAQLGRRIFDVKRVELLGCGTSLYSAEVGRYLLEHYGRIPARAEDAAELATKNPIVDDKTLYIAVSQSGETADTLAAVREVKQRGGLVAGITNVVGSSLARETDFGVYVHAGPEISVCSTKAFSAQVLALNLLTLQLARSRDLSADEGRRWVKALSGLAGQVDHMLGHDAKLAELADRFKKSSYVMFVGRGVSVPVAQEGALKLKEIAYVPADGLSAAGMKHGPLALISEGSPVWALVPPDETRERNLGNLRELKARGAFLMVVADERDAEVGALADVVVGLPEHQPVVSPLLTVIPLQLFAYHVALGLGHDIDKPRNLAKAVTVM